MGKGFTLVELAIVLVIIGLLVGGVLAGQELSKVAKYNRQIGDWEEVKRAMNTYRAKYNRYPGDDNKATTWFGNTTYNGNYNRSVGGGGNARAYYNYNNGYYNEYCLFFQHLEKAGLWNKTHVPDGTAGCGETVFGNVPIQTPGEGYPILMDGNRSWIVIAEAESASGYHKPDDHLICTVYIPYVQMYGQSNANPGYSPLTPEEAHYFDTKLDDGMPMTGGTRAYMTTASILCTGKYIPITGVDKGTGSWCGNSSGYNLTQYEKACALTIRIGM